MPPDRRRHAARRNTRLFGLILTGVGLLVSNPAAAADGDGIRRPTPSPQLQAIETEANRALRAPRFQEQLRALDANGRAVLESKLPTRPTRPARAVYLVLTLDLPDAELRQYFVEAKQLGLTILLRGLWGGSMRTTITRLKQVTGLDQVEAEIRRTTHGGDTRPSPAEIRQRAAVLMGQIAPVQIDPPALRAAGVTQAPALLIRGTTQACVIASRRSLSELVQLAAREWPGFRAWAAWAERRQRSWLRGGPTSDPPPALTVDPPSCRIRVEPPSVTIAERDLAEVFKESVQKHDWRREQREAGTRLVDKLQRGPGLHLPRASRPATRLVDVSAILQEPVVEPVSGRVLGQPGARLNPLERIQTGNWYAVIDATDPSQVRWLDRLAADHPRQPIRILIANGDARPLMARYRRRVFWLSPELLDRLEIRAVPSVIRQQGSHMEVVEYAPAS